MKAIETKHTNDVLGAGDNPGVYDLPITRGNLHDGMPYVESAWLLDDAEQARVADTGVVYFRCMGVTHPPMYLCVWPYDNDAIDAAPADLAIELDLLRRGVCTALSDVFTIRREREDPEYDQKFDEALLCLVRAHNALTVATGENNVVDIDQEGEGVCRICGCTDLAACPEGCCWMDDAHTLGSACAEKCPTCHGSGRIGDDIPCPKCETRGYIERPRPWGDNLNSQSLLADVPASATEEGAS